MIANRTFCYLAFLFLPLSLLAQSLQSPDEKWRMEFALERGRPMVKAWNGDELVMPRQNVGLALVGDSPSLDADFIEQQASASAPTPSDEYSEMSVTLSQRTTARRLTLRFRASNEGISLRYEFPEQAVLKRFTVLFEGKQLDLSAPAETPWLVLAEAHQAALKIDRIEPEFWYAGMKQSELQLMVYGPGIATASVTLGKYDGVTLKEVVPMESPNYLLVYLDVASWAKAGTVPITFSKGKKTIRVKYKLLKREKEGSERMGFWSGDVLYMLMPDRFASGRNRTEPLPDMEPYTVDRSKPGSRHGGDLEGIRQHLDYFTELGVTALWLTPVLKNNNRNGTYHGYSTTNYYRVDPRFGTNEEYRQLVSECHQRGLKLVMDMIFNHCGAGHPWNQDRPCADWFNIPQDGSYQQTSYKLTPVMDPYASQKDLEETTLGWFVRSMPDLNQRNPHVLRYLIQNSKWWIEYAGIDGIRMDTYPYADRQAMSDWMKELNEEYPRFNVVGETWVTQPAYTASWQKDSPLSEVNSNLPSVMDFSFYEAINKAVGEETDGWWKGLNRIYNNFCYDYLYPDPLHVMAFIENHDTDRFLGNGQDVKLLKQALTLLLTTRRIPQLYYGTEVLMNGTKEVTDGYVRKDFPGGWPDDAQNAFTKEGRTPAQQDMFEWLSRLLHWRRTSEAVTCGGMIHFCPVQGCYVYARKHGDNTVLVILNGTNKTVSLSMSRFSEIIGNRTSVLDITSGRSFSLQGELELQSRESLVLPL